MDKKPFYGFGNYLTDSGTTLGSKIVFMLAEDEPTARKMLIAELSEEGDLVPNSLGVYLGSSVPVAWLLAAAMQSEGADWSSGTMSVAQAPAIPKKEYLN